MGPLVRFEGQIESWEWAFSVRSFTNPDTRYTVTVRLDDGTVSCECMDAVGRRKNRGGTLVENNCKHVRQIVKTAVRLNRRNRE
mgnify:CR=1 FL=1